MLHIRNKLRADCVRMIFDAIGYPVMKVHATTFLLEQSLHVLTLCNTERKFLLIRVE